MINDKLQPFFCRTTKEQLGVPKANIDALYKSSATPEENQLLRILQIKYRKNKLALLVRILQLESNPKLLLQTLNLADFSYLLDDSVDISQIDYADYSEDVKKLIGNCTNTTKFECCINLVTSLVGQGKSMIIWCMFVDSIRNLSAELQKHGIHTCCIYGEVPLEERQQIILDFKSKKIQVLLTNPHTLAESVSLHSVCHDAIYLSTVII